MVEKRSIEEAFQALEHAIEGEVRSDKLSRMLYSTDASIYQVEPYGVVLPRHEEDLHRTVEIAGHYGVPLIPRAAGTSLSGQCVGKGIIVDISKYMNKILDYDAEEGWALVEPGVIQDDLSRFVEKDNLMFAPDTSTSNRAMIGGMIGNNSCGAHSIVYGKTVDHTLELDVILSDGSRARFRDLTPEELEKKKQLKTLEGHIYREVTRIIDEYREDIRERYPKILRRNTGYLLDEFVDTDKPFNLSRLIAGSEGTLALISKARVKLVQRPVMNGLMAIQFEDLTEALRSTVVALEYDPCAVELIDRVIIDLANKNRVARKLRFFIEGKPDAILAVEFYGKSREEIEAKMNGLEAHLKREKLGYTYPRLWGGDIKKVWALRKAGLGLLTSLEGDAKPITIIEDTGVDPQHLPEYIAEFKEIMKKHDATSVYYAHASVGVLHMRPILDLKKPRDVERMEAIANDIADLVVKYGGSLSSEHGDGRLRSPFHKKFFGERLYNALREVKRAFDPHNIFNPNKIIDPPPLTEDLRYHKGYITHHVPTILDFGPEGGYLRSAESCNGAGACRKSHLAQGTMCPSYQATREEQHTTRARANMLRTAIAQYGPEEAFKMEEVWETMDLCLECKACKSECPSDVDMAKLKYEYLQRRWDLIGTPLSALVMGNIHLVNAISAPFASLVNAFLASRLGKWLTELFLNIDRRRSFPKYAKQTARQWFKKHRPHPNAAQNGRTVYFFADQFVNYNDPHLAIATVETLEAAGYQVKLAPITNDGRASISKGLLRKAKKIARKNLPFLKQLVEEDSVMVGAEPSTILTFRDEYPDFFPEEAFLKEMASRCLMIDEFIANEISNGSFQVELARIEHKYLFHGHCYQKSHVGTESTLKMLSIIPGVTTEEIPSGCCGMAGSFGYDKKKYDISLRIGELVLMPAVRERGDAEVLATGTSCRHQIHDAAHYDAQAPIEILHRSIKLAQHPS